jgi:hypothetical protein
MTEIAHWRPDSIAAAGEVEVSVVIRAGFPFFNLYKLLVVMSGRRLVSHPAAGQGRPARLLSRLFGVLFLGNLSASPFGWQLLALLRRPLSRAGTVARDTSTTSVSG